MKAIALGVEAAAAAEGHDPVVIAVAEGRHPGVHICARRVALDVAEQAGLEALGAAGFYRVAHHREVGQPRVGHDQRPRDAELGAGCGQLGDAPGAEAERRRIVPVATQRHSGLPQVAVRKWYDLGRVRTS
jgi:hypothetical protein